MASVPALQLEDIRKQYQGEKGKPGTEALKGVSLTVEEGEFFALLGPNGAGKTSLISILAGLSKKTSGTALVCGVSIDSHAELAKSYIGIVPQEFNLNWFETVEDIIVNQAGYYGIPRKEATERMLRLTSELGLAEKRKERSMKLSGGMKRRLMIARALIHEPKVLLLDEPTAGVDVELRRSMWEFLRKLNESGTTIILTTHYLEEAEQLCRRVAIVNKGEVVREGSVKELLTTLNFVTLTLDLKEPVTPAQMALLKGHDVKRQDEVTLELTLKPGLSVNEAMRDFSRIGVQVMNVRNTGSRLEEVFINLVEKR